MGKLELIIYLGMKIGILTLKGLKQGMGVQKLGETEKTFASESRVFFKIQGRSSKRNGGGPEFPRYRSLPS